MKGTLRERPFAEIVGVIFQGKQTGELKVTAAGKAISIHFQDGNPVAAASDDPSHRIARILLDNEKIGLGEAEMLGGLPESKQAFETVEYIPPDTLLWGVKFRFLRLLEELFSWEDGEYGFTEGPVPPEALTLRVPTPFIIFTGTAKMPAAAFDSLGDDMTIAEVREIPGEQDSFFNPQRKKFLAACRPGMTVGELIAEMAGDRERARHTLYAFKALGLVTIAEPAPAPEPPLTLFGDEDNPEPETEAPTALSFEPELPDAPAEDEPLSLVDDAEEPAPEPAEFPTDGVEPELSLESPPDAEPEEVSLAAEEEAPLTLEDGPEDSLEDAAPELPLEMPSSGDSEEETVSEAERPGGADSGVTLPSDGMSPGTTDMDDGVSIFRSMGGLDDEEDAAGLTTEEPPEKQKKGRRLVPPSRTGKIAAIGAVLLLVIGGSLLGLRTLGEKPVPPPEMATAVAPVPPPEPEAAAVATPPGGEAEGEGSATVSSKADEPAAGGEPPSAAADGGRGQERSDLSAAGDAAGTETPIDEPPAARAPEEAPEVNAPAVAAEDVRPAVPAAVAGGDPLEAMQAGDVAAAARLWAKELRQKPQDTYTIQVLMACEAGSVQESYPLFRSHGEAYTVPFSLKGRDCYRVGLGTYDSLAGAKAALGELPREILRNGAVVKGLGQFLPGETPPPPRAAQSEPSPAAPVPVAETPGAAVPEVSPADYGAAMDTFQAGDLAAAAGLWQGLLRRSPPGTYTLQVLTACDGDTVKNYFAIFEEHGRVFAVPIRLQGRDCYRVGLETYPSKKAAETALAAMPAWVRDQRTVVKSIAFFTK